MGFCHRTLAARLAAASGRYGNAERMPDTSGSSRSHLAASGEMRRCCSRRASLGPFAWADQTRFFGAGRLRVSRGRRCVRAARPFEKPCRTSAAAALPPPSPVSVARSAPRSRLRRRPTDSSAVAADARHVTTRMRLPLLWRLASLRAPIPQHRPPRPGILWLQ